ncbi:MAG: hydrogenase maturation protease [Acidimicrobiales bacterium]
MLVAGIGNIFLSDDGFGSEVARRLAAPGAGLPDGVEVGDFGIGGLHLAYELLDPPAATILVDTTRRGGEPGTLYVIEPDPAPHPGEGLAPGAGAGAPEGGATLDAHGMNPEAVFALLGQLGGTLGRMLVVGCEPARLEEGLGLSPPVAAAVDEAVALVSRVVGEEVARLPVSHDHPGPGPAPGLEPTRR